MAPVELALSTQLQPPAVEASQLKFQIGSYPTSTIDSLKSSNIRERDTSALGTGTEPTAE